MMVNGIHYDNMDFYDFTEDGRIICKLCGREVKSYRGRRTHLTVKHADYFGVQEAKTQWINICEFTRKQRENHAMKMAEWYN